MRKQIYWVLVIIFCLVIVSWFLVFGIGGCASTQQELITTTTSSTTSTTTTTTTTTTTIAGSWVNLGPADGISAGGVNYLSLKVFKGIPYLAYADAANGSKATLLKYNAGSDSWENVGLAGFSDGWVGFTYLYIYDDGSAGGVPYIGINNGLNNSTLAVMKYNRLSGTWENLGKSSLTSETYAYNAPLYVYDDGTTDGQPYIAFSSGFVGGYAIRTAARKYNKSTGNWDLLGNPEFPTNNPADHSVSLAVSSDGTPYLAYIDYDRTKVTVNKYISGSWEAAGAAAFSDATTSVRLAYSNDNLYVSCFGVKAYQFDKGSSSWTQVGDYGYPAQAINKYYYVDTEPVVGPVAYAVFDETSSAEPTVQKASVMKYNGSAWQYIGAPRFSDGQPWSNIAIDVYNGVPYIAYADYSHGGFAAAKVVVKKFE